MSTYISLLRGINVGGQKKILMADLKALYESLGFKNVRTYVQSGNVIFEAAKMNFPRLEEKIEKGIMKKYGFDVSTIVRDAAYFKRVIDKNPYKAAGAVNPVLPYIMFLKNAPVAAAVKSIDKPKGERGEFTVLGAEIYLLPAEGYGTTKLNNNFFEKKLGIPATARNMKTVNALYNIAAV